MIRMGHRFGAGLSPLGGRGHWVLGWTLGWDGGPFVTLGLLKWMLVIGWCDWEHEGFAEYERQATRRIMRRDYWDETRTFKVAVNKIHDPDSDLPFHFVFDSLMEEAKIQDGDEYEMMVTATDRRPHGDRRWLRARDGGTFVGRLGNFRAETDNECLRRIENDGNKE